MVLDFNLPRFGLAVMTGLEIGLLMMGWFISVIIFYSMGVDSGYVEGRRALRKHYEKQEKVRL